ncbi:hypothetical protein DL766_005244 [Monosporascus sp. MC13-8B]|uniref:Uncharacterized protein n=1 Tax=Monosporascus cannonballus TaxID=155416 RepID=A0ABY0GXM1_9PEZI|nr:hypothetical protein DL762_009072 [Monosporascus cannonballus]RYP29689.1 hypothetical protein DL766_005244 [Monosporascus sp. MC13-8B]
MGLTAADASAAADVAIELFPKNSAWDNSHIGGFRFGAPYQTQRTDMRQNFMDSDYVQQTFGYLENAPQYPIFLMTVEYAEAFVDSYYEGPNAVACDAELQTWLDEVNSAAASPDGRARARRRHPHALRTSGSAGGHPYADKGNTP